MPEELWMEVHKIVQEVLNKIILEKKKCKKAKQLSEDAIQTAEKEERQKGKGKEKRYSHLNAAFQRIAKKDKKDFLSDHCKEIKDRIEWERLEISSRKLEIPREYFMQRWAQ